MNLQAKGFAEASEEGTDSLGAPLQRKGELSTAASFHDIAERSLLRRLDKGHQSICFLPMGTLTHRRKRRQAGDLKLASFGHHLA